MNNPPLWFVVSYGAGAVSAYVWALVQSFRGRL